MSHQLVEGLQRFRREYFPKFREHYQRLVSEGQNPNTLFIGCADSRVVPDLLTSTLPGDLFVVRNVGNFVPPFETTEGFHGVSAGIEFATTVLEVKDIVICGHSHCGAIRALFKPMRDDAPNISKWLELARPAMTSTELTDDALRQTEMRSVALQVERLMTFPMVRERVERGELCLHGWYYVIEEGRVLGLDIATGEFSPLS
ncbi:MAG: carbonic anhydrase [Vicinamibacteraceae bacterium]